MITEQDETLFNQLFETEVISQGEYFSTHGHYEQKQAWTTGDSVFRVDVYDGPRGKGFVLVMQKEFMEKCRGYGSEARDRDWYVVAE